MKTENDASGGWLTERLFEGHLSVLRRLNESASDEEVKRFCDFLLNGRLVCSPVEADNLPPALEQE